MTFEEWWQQQVAKHGDKMYEVDQEEIAKMAWKACRDNVYEEAFDEGYDAGYIDETKGTKRTKEQIETYLGWQKDKKNKEGD